MAAPLTPELKLTNVPYVPWTWYFRELLTVDDIAIAVLAPSVVFVWYDIIVSFAAKIPVI